MSNYDKDFRDPGYQTRLPGAGGGSNTWIGAAVVVVLLLIAVGYVFSNRASTSPGMVEHRAAATDTATPAAPAPPPSAPSSPDAKP